MPGSSSARALGANPTPMAYAEVYTGLQTGAIDGQDNPLPNVENMKFYEVMSQIVLTSHLVGFDLLTVSKKAWDAMAPRSRRPSRRPQTRRSTSPPKAPDPRKGTGRELQVQGPEDLRARCRGVP